MHTAIAAALRRSPGARPPSALTRRQTDTLALVASGLTNTAIAARLGLSHSTVKKHFAGAYRQLGARNRSDATNRAREIGLLSWPT